MDTKAFFLYTESTYAYGEVGSTGEQFSYCAFYKSCIPVSAEIALFKDKIN